MLGHIQSSDIVTHISVPPWWRKWAGIFEKLAQLTLNNEPIVAVLMVLTFLRVSVVSISRTREMIEPHFLPWRLVDEW